MRKILLVVMCAFLVLLAGCAKNLEKKLISQEITIVTTQSPSKCKTTSSLQVIEQILNILRSVEKSPVDTLNESDEFVLLLELKVDNEVFYYTISTSTFTDSDGAQYSICGVPIIDNIMEIYNELDVQESNYN